MANSTSNDRVRIVEERLLSDDWYTLKKTKSTIDVGTVTGKGKAAKLMIAGTVPFSCCSTLLARPWF